MSDSDDSRKSTPPVSVRQETAAETEISDTHEVDKPVRSKSLPQQETGYVEQSQTNTNDSNDDLKHHRIEQLRTRAEGLASRGSYGKAYTSALAAWKVACSLPEATSATVRKELLAMMERYGAEANRRATDGSTDTPKRVIVK